jgi:hypothetical protein
LRKGVRLLQLELIAKMSLFAQYGTVSDIEILWLVVASIGALFAGWNALDAHKDCKALDLANIHNGRRLVARATRAQDALRFCVHLIFVSIGIMACILSDPPDRLEQPWQNVVIQVLVTWGLITAAVILMIGTAIGRYSRYELLREERRERQSKL